MKLMAIKNRGFTLMELMIVVGIITILAAVGFSNYIFSLKKSHDAARKSDLSTIAKSLEVFANDFTDYPDDDNAGNIIACGTDAALTACSWGDPMEVTIGGSAQTYLSKIPKDPIDGQYYYYIKTAEGYDLYAGLENISDPSYKLTGLPCGDLECSYTLTQAGTR